MTERGVSPQADNPSKGIGTETKKWSWVWSYLVNGLTLAAQATGFTIAGGTTSKTLTVDETVALSAKANLASPTLTGTPLAPTAADNTATTQLATTAFAKSQDAVLARLPDQAVNMTYAASGSSGIAVADNDNIDFGTGNFTLVWRGSLPDWGSGAEGVVLISKYAAAATSYCLLRPWTGRTLALSLADGTSSINLVTTATYQTINGTSAEWTVSVAIGAVNAVASFYLNGVLFDTVTTSKVGSISNSHKFYVLGGDSSRTAGTCSFAATYNRALTATEVLDLYRNGIAYADKWGSQTELFGAWNFTSGWSTSSVTINDSNTFTITSSEGYIYKTIATNEKRYRMRIAGTAAVGITNFYVCGVTIYKDGMTGTFDETFEFMANHQTNALLLRGSGTGQIDITTLELYEIGATLALEPEGIQPAPGQWLDSSTNKLHAMQPATGSSLTRKKDTFEVRWTTTWAGTHEAQQIGGVSQGVLPVGCYIEEIVGVVTGATPHDIIIGDGSDTDRWVAITSGLAAGTTSFTIANKISDGTNYKLVVDPDTNATMSIAWTIRGRILQ